MFIERPAAEIEPSLAMRSSSATLPGPRRPSWSKSMRILRRGIVPHFHLVIHLPPPSYGGGGPGRGAGGREKPQWRYLQISDLKFSEIVREAFPLRPLQGHLPRKTG